MAAALYAEMDTEVGDLVDEVYFEDCHEFKPLLVVLDVVGTAFTGVEDSSTKSSIREQLQQSDKYRRLLQQQEKVAVTIEDVAKKQEGGMNNAVDTMGSVIQTYTSSRDQLQSLRQSLLEVTEILSPGGTKSSMTVKKGAKSLRELWGRKAEHESYLDILDDLEMVRK